MVSPPRDRSPAVHWLRIRFAPGQADAGSGCQGGVPLHPYNPDHGECPQVRALGFSGGKRDGSARFAGKILLHEKGLGVTR